MKKTPFLLLILIFSTIHLSAQSKWDFNFSLGSSLHAGNVNSFNLNNGISVNRNDSLVALDFHYKLLYSSLIDKNNPEHLWEETNFEINGGVKMDLYQYGRFSPFLACEMLTNKYKGYDLKMSSLIGMKYKIYAKPDVCDYSISAAVVYDWCDYTDATVLPVNNFRISIRPKIRQKLGENLTLYHCTFYQPSVLDFSDFLINSETKLQTKITKKLFLDLSFLYEYRSKVPSESYHHSDILTEVSIRLKL